MTIIMVLIIIRIRSVTYKRIDNTKDGDIKIEDDNDNGNEKWTNDDDNGNDNENDNDKKINIPSKEIWKRATKEED